MKTQNVKIPQTLFVNLCQYFLVSEESRPENIETKIINQLYDKVDSIHRHNLYGEAKNKSLTEEQRKIAYEEYLKHK